MGSLKNIFLQYNGTYEVPIDYPTIGDEDIKDHVNKEIMNHLHANIDFHSRRLISEFPGGGVNLIPSVIIIV